jgi:putative oxidoreductase
MKSIVAINVTKWENVDSLETLLGFEEATYLAIAGPSAASLDRLLLRMTGQESEPQQVV